MIGREPHETLDSTSDMGKIESLFSKRIFFFFFQSTDFLIALKASENCWW